ncbi:fungal-specific transcription factor domain-containing protein [Exophiala viscosa]|uniref:fungal-specific transcription factor domain-containing protein n=1 Tax=Exophiala viscosa TaxID=2486360 RepID=UPI0021911B04|nr:fungal-specific transcription factor domain-containing protein [Exophiala viscosa]
MPQTNNSLGAIMLGNHSSYENADEPARAEYSCMFCKKRKVKCDRTLPSCSICRKTQQECQYPSDGGKPGPKLGTTRRKRPRAGSVDKQSSRKSTQECFTALASHERGASNVEAVTNATLLPSVANADNEPGAAAQSPSQKPYESYPLTPATTPLDVRTLAYIMHPSHDTAAISPLLKDFDGPTHGTARWDVGSGTGNKIAQACTLLGISRQSLQPYLNLYFDNMTAFSLFHQPSFGETLRNIGSVTQLAALLASMLAFSARFRSSTEECVQAGQPDSLNDMLGRPLPPLYFENLSQLCVDKALEEYSDSTPSLPVLQALVLLTFQQLIKGARGSAWRRLGVCIRVAYELNLHHVDRYNTPEEDDPQIWCKIEERRRAWWAIWEMDVFASMIKRCPITIDWTDQETRFPVPDDDWYQLRFSSSCFLELKPMDRLKALQQCGTQSPKSWFIVLDSLMRDGHTLSKFRSPRPGIGKPGSSRSTWRTPDKDNSETLAILNNTLRCFCMALPKSLRQPGGSMAFTSTDPAAVVATRRLQSAQYSIHVTIQLTRMMLHHQDAYYGAQQDLQLTDSRFAQEQERRAAIENQSLSLHLGPTRKGLQQFIEAADELLRIVSCSSEDHVRYVNPFLASIIWYGAVVHLGWKILAPPSTNLDWVESKFAVMHMILGKFAEFWDLPRALQENLASVEEKLSLFTRPQTRKLSRGWAAVDGHSSKPATGAKRSAGSQESSSEDSSMGRRAAAESFPTGRHGSQPLQSSSKENPSIAEPDPKDRTPFDFDPLDGRDSGVCSNDYVQGGEQAFEPGLVPTLGGDMLVKDSSFDNGEFLFDESCLMDMDIVTSNGTSASVARENNPLRPGLWDDLQWDMNSATDPGRLLLNIMDYN